MARVAERPEVRCPRTGLVLSYTGDELPAWVRAGARVRVKSTPQTRFRGGDGLRCRGVGQDEYLWAGEVGEVALNVRPHATDADVAAGKCYYGGTPYIAGRGGWYEFQVNFSRGRGLHLHARDMEYLVRLPTGKATEPSET